MGQVKANGTVIAAEGQVNQDSVDLGNGFSAKVVKHQDEGGYASVEAGQFGLTSTQTVPANGREININGVRIMHERG